MYNVTLKSESAPLAASLHNAAARQLVGQGLAKSGRRSGQEHTFASQLHDTLLSSPATKRPTSVAAVA